MGKEKLVFVGNVRVRRGFKGEAIGGIAVSSIKLKPWVGSRVKITVEREEASA